MHWRGCGAAAGRRRSGEAVGRHPGRVSLVMRLGSGWVAALSIWRSGGGSLTSEAVGQQRGDGAQCGVRAR